MKAQLCSTSEILGLHYSQEGFKEPKSIWLPHDLVFEVSLENLQNDKVAFYKLKLRMFGSKISWQIHGKDLTSNIKHVPWVKKKTDHDWNSGWCLRHFLNLFCVSVTRRPMTRRHSCWWQNYQKSFAWSVLWKFYQKTKQLKDHLCLYTKKWKLWPKRC